MFPKSQAFEARQVVALTGVDERALRHWAACKVVIPEIHEAAGRPGIRRQYSYKNLVEICIVDELVQQGINLRVAAEAVQVFRKQAWGIPPQGRSYLVIRARRSQPGVQRSASTAYELRLLKGLPDYDRAVTVVPIHRIRAWLAHRLKSTRS